MEVAFELCLALYLHVDVHATLLEPDLSEDYRNAHDWSHNTYSLLARSFFVSSWSTNYASETKEPKSGSQTYASYPITHASLKIVHGIFYECQLYHMRSHPFWMCWCELVQLIYVESALQWNSWRASFLLSNFIIAVLMFLQLVLFTCCIFKIIYLLCKLDFQFACISRPLLFMFLVLLSNNDSLMYCAVCVLLRERQQNTECTTHETMIPAKLIWN